MVTVTSENGKLVLKDIVPITNETAEKLEAVIKTNKKAVASAMKDLGIDHWIETKGEQRFTIVSRKYTNDSGLDMMEEVKSLRFAHNRFVDLLLYSMKIQEPAPEQANDAPEETDEEAEKFLDYALVCKLQELVSSCSAIIIAIPK